MEAYVSSPRMQNINLGIWLYRLRWGLYVKMAKIENRVLNCHFRIETRIVQSMVIRIHPL
jgi:hypothetical protein